MTLICRHRFAEVRDVWPDDYAAPTQEILKVDRTGCERETSGVSFRQYELPHWARPYYKSDPGDSDDKMKVLRDAKEIVKAGVQRGWLGFSKFSLATKPPTKPEPIIDWMI